MTKISTMRGIRDIETADVLEPAKINYNGLSEGELQVLFLKEQNKLMASLYPDQRETAQWNRNVNRIDDYFYKGSQGFSFTGLWNSEETEVARAISMNLKRNRPANGMVIVPNMRKDVAVGGLFDTTKEYNAILDDCISQKIRSQSLYGVPSNDPRIVQFKEDCQLKFGGNQIGYWLNLMNDDKVGLEKNSMQFLYNWVDPSVFSDETIEFDRRYKMRQHSEHILELSKWSNLSTYNLLGWSRMGVMRSTAKYLGDVFNPEMAIEYLKNNPNVPILNLDEKEKYADQIGFPFIALAICILASCIGVAGVVQAVQGREPTAFSYIKQLGSLAQANSPGGSDWTSKIKDVLPTGGTGVKPPIKTNTKPPIPPKNNAPDLLSGNTKYYIGGAVLIGGVLYYFNQK
jgi:hypothetical protein